MKAGPSVTKLKQGVKTLYGGLSDAWEQKEAACGLVSAIANVETDANAGPTWVFGGELVCVRGFGGRLVGWYRYRYRGRGAGAGGGIESG